MDKKTLVIKIENFYNEGFSNNTLNELISYVLNDLPDTAFKKSRILKIKHDLAQEKIEDQKLHEYFLEFSNWVFFMFFGNEKPNWLKTALTQYLKQNPNAIKYYTYDDFFKLGWNIKDVMISAISISNDNIDNYNSTDEDLVHWIKLREKNLNFYIGIEFCGELIGQLGLIILTEEEYFLLRKGEIDEEDIKGTIDDKTSSFFLYVSTIVIKKEFRNKNVLKKLLVKADQVFFPEPNRIKAILAIAYTEKGSKMCRSLGFQFIQNHPKNGEIYEGYLHNIYQSKIFNNLIH